MGDILWDTAKFVLGVVALAVAIVWVVYHLIGWLAWLIAVAAAVFIIIKLRGLRVRNAGR